jgi:hypothetical protein
MKLARRHVAYMPPIGKHIYRWLILKRKTAQIPIVMDAATLPEAVSTYPSYVNDKELAL